MTVTQKITPNLWFDTQAEEAATFYTSLFKNATVNTRTYYGKEGYEVHGMPEGAALTVDFQLEGQTFICPWTDKKLSAGAYDVDHIIPIAVFPFNDLWNLVPSDPYFDSHVKRARIPSPEKLNRAVPHLIHAYANYQASRQLAPVLHEDVSLRFRVLLNGYAPIDIATAVLNLTESIATARNAPRF